jgi:hypothetical protein
MKAARGKCAHAGIWGGGLLLGDLGCSWPRAWSRKLDDWPFVINGHIKSAKHSGHEACFVLRGSGRERFERIAKNLKTDQELSVQKSRT